MRLIVKIELHQAKSPCPYGERAADKPLELLWKRVEKLSISAGGAGAPDVDKQADR
jgi:hypothetical protein